MKTIRHNTFETNSSSMHALVISNEYFTKDSGQVSHFTMDLGIDFSRRTLILRKTPTEKASYLFHLIIQHFNKHITAHGKQVGKSWGVFEPLTDEEKAHNEVVFQVYAMWCDALKAHAKRHFAVDVEYDNAIITRAMHETFNENNEFEYYAIVSADEYASTGCYGNDALISVLLQRMFDDIDTEIKNFGVEADENPRFKTHPMSTDYWWSVNDMLEFILSDKSTLIQNTDECDEEEMDKMKRYIADYCYKNNFECQVIWPVGG